MKFPEKAPADRDVALKQRRRGRKQIPVEERKNIASARVQWVDPHSNRIVHFESVLEWRAALIIATMPGVTAISSQYGPVWFQQAGIWRKHYFDLCVDYANGCRALFAVKVKKRSAEVETHLELMRNHELHKHAQFAELLTEEDITKPAVYRASSILRSRKMRNRENDRMVFEALARQGGRARVFDVLNGLPGVTFSSAWDSMWSLIDLGQIVHDHPEAERTFLEEHSFIFTTQERQ